MNTFAGGPPRWLPVDKDGEHWQFMAWGNRCLGFIVKLTGCESLPFMSHRLADDSWLESDTIREAAVHIENRA
jgi:hypothetical protein